MPAAGPLPPVLVFSGGGVPAVGAGQTGCCRQEKPRRAAHGWVFGRVGCWCGAVKDAELFHQCSRFRAGLVNLIDSKRLHTRKKTACQKPDIALRAEPSCPAASLRS